MFGALRWAALSFVLVFVVTLGFRLVTGRSAGRVADALALDDPSAARQTIATDARPGEAPTQIGTLAFHNTSDAVVTLSRAVVSSIDPGLGVAGFAVLYPNENDSLLGGQCGPFPPPNFATHPVEGARIGPDEHASLVVAVRATREGEFAFENVRVFYEAEGRRFHQDLPIRALVRARSSNPPCRFDPEPHQRAGNRSAY